MDDDDLVGCPICSLFCQQSEIEEHVALHFEDEVRANHAAARGRPQQQHKQEQLDAVHIDDDLDDELDVDGQKVYCSFGCGALLALHELDSHEEAHRSGRLQSTCCLACNRSSVVDIDIVLARLQEYILLL
jgi:hypothetical protein